MKLLHELDGRAALRRGLFVFQPEDAKVFLADVVARHTLLLIRQVNDIKVNVLLLVFTGERDGRTVLFVAQQCIKPVPKL